MDQTQIRLGCVFACESDNVSILKLALKHLDDYACKADLLKMCCIKNTKNTARYLIESGTHLDGFTGEYNDMSPLHLCAIHSNVEIAKMLLQAGADINVSIGSRGSPLQTALHFGMDNMVELLLQHNADTNFKINGKNILTYGAIHCTTSIFRNLLRHGCKGHNSHIPEIKEQWLKQTEGHIRTLRSLLCAKHTGTEVSYYICSEIPNELTDLQRLELVTTGRIKGPEVDTPTLSELFTDD